MDTTPTNNEDLLKFMKTLADAERLKIAGLLGVEALTPTQIAERFGLKPAEVARHLEQLAAAGLAHREGDAYRLDSQVLEKFSRRVLAQSRPPAPEFEGDEFERKTLRAYIARDGTLKDLPNQHKKLMVILHHLVKNFAPDKRYTEREINDILRRYHEDTAALRRYMVDNGLMAREKGEYWRTSA